MSLANKVLGVNDNLPIRTEKPVHRGKVRSVYWLTEEDSRRLVVEQGYDVSEGASLAIMVISDRISAFDCIWRGEGGLDGIPGKGAALNAISSHWFRLFRERGLADSHIVDIPHPLVWIVQQARPVKIEAICRQYITGSLWRAYERGERQVCGVKLTDGLERDQKLADLLLTPSTKGVLEGVPGVPAQDDVNISRSDIHNNYQAFGLSSPDDIATYEQLSRDGFMVISRALAELDQIFVDTKFEFGYLSDASGRERLIFIDEVGTPDSSRIWDGQAWHRGQIVENSKEDFRQLLLSMVADPEVLLDKGRMSERQALAQEMVLPEAAMMAVSRTYMGIAEKITGQKLALSHHPRAEIIQVLGERYRLIVE